jgi:hypothetical protein
VVNRQFRADVSNWCAVSTSRSIENRRAAVCAAVYPKLRPVLTAQRREALTTGRDELQKTKTLHRTSRDNLQPPALSTATTRTRRSLPTITPKPHRYAASIQQYHGSCCGGA